jgi:23S rRNA (guanosine2251-2'-O)-methyltransferase
MMKKTKLDNIVFGTWPILEALREARTFNKIFILTGNKTEELVEIRSLCKGLNIPIQMVPIQKLDRLTRKNHQGIIGFTSPISFHNIEDIIPMIYEKGKDPFLLILDRITDVRNFGAICRTAEAAGVDAILIPEKESAMIGSDAVKTSAGAIYNLPICRTKHFTHNINFIIESGIKLVACSEKVPTDFKDADYTGPLALVMGSEEDGISKDLLNQCDVQVQIPMMGKTGSLNVSVACGILLYEIAHQKK